MEVLNNILENAVKYSKEQTQIKIEVYPLELFTEIRITDQGIGIKKAEQTAFARTLLLDALRKEYGITRLPEITRTPYGKPYFLNYPELYFNYSHSKHAAACVLSKQAVGIDLEQIRNYSEKTAQRFCSQGEWSWLQRQPDLNKAWIQIWTMKEAWLKYRGTGLRVDLRDLDFTSALENASAQSAARTPRILLAAMDIPIPVPQIRIPMSSGWEATAVPTALAITG